MHSKPCFAFSLQLSSAEQLERKEEEKEAKPQNGVTGGVKEAVDNTRCSRCKWSGR